MKSMIAVTCLILVAAADRVLMTEHQVPAGERLSASNSSVPAVAKPDLAVERAKREMRMLDDLYKTSIVLITTHYVDDETSLPAGSAFQALFATMKEKGWHEVRLLDATGNPTNADNAPRPGFEEAAVKAISEGRPGLDEVITINGQRHLLAATPIPVVMDKCIMCHEHYKGVASGKAIGALGYRIPIIDDVPSTKFE